MKTGLVVKKKKVTRFRGSDMNLKTKFVWVMGLMVVVFSAHAGEILLGGYAWTVRSGHGGSGPNAWEEKNVWLDAVPTCT